MKGRKCRNPTGAESSRRPRRQVADFPDVAGKVLRRVEFSTARAEHVITLFFADKTDLCL